MDIRHRQFEKLPFVDPVPVLQGLRRVEIQMATSNPEFASLSQSARRLRTNELKSARESRDAAIFAHGMAQVLGTKVYFAPVEDDDYDFVTMCVLDGVQYFSPVQLKELHPEDLARGQSIEGLLAGAGRYSPTDTTLAVRLNRRGSCDLTSLEIPQIPFVELWFFWCSSPEQSEWQIYGDALGAAEQFSFGYPNHTG